MATGLAFQAAIAVGPSIVEEIIKNAAEARLEKKCLDSVATLGGVSNVCIDSQNGPLMAGKPFQYNRKWKSDGKIWINGETSNIPKVNACDIGCEAFVENAAGSPASVKNYDIGSIGHDGDNIGIISFSATVPKKKCDKAFDSGSCLDGVANAVSEGRGFNGPYGTMDVSWTELEDDETAWCDYTFKTKAAYCNEGCGLEGGEFAPYRSCAKWDNCYLWNGEMWNGPKPNNPQGDEKTKCGKSDCETCKPKTYICAKDGEYKETLSFGLRDRLLWQNTPKCVSESVDARNNALQKFFDCRAKFGCKQAKDICKTHPCASHCVTNRTSDYFNKACFPPTYDKDNDTLTAKCLHRVGAEGWGKSDFSLGDASSCAEIDYDILRKELVCKKQCTPQEKLDGNYDTLCKDKNAGDCAFEHTVEVGDCYTYKGKRWAGTGPEKTGGRIDCQRVPDKYGGGGGTHLINCKDEYYNNDTCGSKGECKACPTKSKCAIKCGEKTVDKPDMCLETEIDQMFIDGYWAMGTNCINMPDEQSCDAANSFTEFGGEGRCVWKTDSATGNPGCFKQYLDQCTITPGMVQAISKPYKYKHDDGREYYGVKCVNKASECPAGETCMVLDKCPNSSCQNAFGDTCCRVDGTDGGGGKTPEQWLAAYKNTFAPGAFDECNFNDVNKTEKFSWNGYWWYGKKPAKPANTRCGLESCCPVPGSNEGIPEYEQYGNGGWRKTTKYLTPPEGVGSGETIEYLLQEELKEVEACFTPEIQQLASGSTEIRDAAYKSCMNNSLKSYFDKVAFQDGYTYTPMTDNEFATRPMTCDAVENAPKI